MQYPCKHSVTRHCGLCELEPQLNNSKSKEELLKDIIAAWDSGGGFALVVACEEGKKYE